MSWKFTKEDREKAPPITKQRLRGISGFVGAASQLVDIYEKCLKGHNHQAVSDAAELKSRKCVRCNFIWQSDEPVDEEKELSAISNAMLSCVTKMAKEAGEAKVATPRSYLQAEDMSVITSLIPFCPLLTMSKSWCRVRMRRATSRNYWMKVVHFGKIGRRWRLSKTRRYQKLKRRNFSHRCCRQPRWDERLPVSSIGISHCFRSSRPIVRRPALIQSIRNSKML